METNASRDRLVAVVRALAMERRAEIDRLKAGAAGLERSDFLWHELLQSFSTMGRASGRRGLIENQDNYRRVTYDALAALAPRARRQRVLKVCRAAGIRMPNQKAEYILGCFDHVQRLGGPKAAKAQLLAEAGREAKIRFLDALPGIGPKYARNIMMDVYHPDFRDSIALDVRIHAISAALGLSFASYADHEAFYLGVAKDAGLDGWELDRPLFHFRRDVEARLRAAKLPPTNSRRASSDGRRPRREAPMSATICSVTFEIDAQGHAEGRFSVPMGVCRILQLRPGDRIGLAIETPRGAFKVTKALSSGTEIYGAGIAKRVRPGDRLRVTASRPIV